MALEQTDNFRYAGNEWLFLWLVATTLGLGTIASCSSAAQTHPRIPSKSVEVHGEDYEIITCRGANQSNIACPAGEPRRFEGALVCKLAGRWAEPIPQELCAQLPNGCTPYVPPRPKSDDLSLPRDYVAALSAVLPNVKDCGQARVAFSRIGTSTPFSNLERRLETALEKSIPHKESLAIGVGRCCDTATNTLCANLFLHGDIAVSPTALAEAVAQSVNSVVADNVGVTIVVQRFQKAARCAPTDPDCGPQLVGDGCLDKIHYDWGGPKKALLPEIPEPGDECVHDGDCFIEKSECQWICRGWRSFVPIWQAGGGCRESSSRHWGSAMCGCYNGRCALLYQ